VERLLGALANHSRLQILVWLLDRGPMRQVDIRAELEQARASPVNPGEVSGLLKPLLEQRILVRAAGQSRGPISVRDPQQLTRLLQAAAALDVGTAQEQYESAKAREDELRRALMREIPNPRTRPRERG
jgi:hypothetical protein